MKTTFPACLIAVALLAPLMGVAQNRSFITADGGLYSKFEIGPTFRPDGEVTKFGGFSTGNTISYDVGFDFDMAIGYAFNKWVSVEGEFGWNGNQISGVQGFQLQDTYLYNVPFIANIVFQYPIRRTRLIPYAGGGGGGSVSIFDTDLFSNGAVTLVGNESDFVYAYQAFAGVRFEINDKMSAGLGYKYFGTGDSSYSFESTSGGPDFNLGVSGGGVHMVLCTFNWKF